MIRRNLLFCILAVFAVNFVAAQTENVLVIIADDLGIDYMNRYNIGSDPAPTPVLDSLSDNGLLFTNAWTNPICSPSRANILTGKYAFRTGIGTAITNAQSPSLDTAEYTLAKAVRAQDIGTAMVGKWHLGHGMQAFRRNPNECGFDHYAGNIEGQLPSYSIWQKTVNGANFNVFQYATTVTVNDAIDWVDDQVDESSDWMLFLSFNAPHEPFHRPPNNLHSFDGITTNPILIAQNPRPHFKAMIEAMDTEIGRFLEHLRTINELANTTIIFIGDNGSPPDVAQAPFVETKMKGTMYNGGVRVPMIVSGPSVISPGREVSELVNSTDIYHTVYEILNGDVESLPEGVAPDSRSFLPMITNSSDSGDQRSWIYADLFRPTPNFKDGKAITNGNYKLIEFDNGNTEFYQISADIFENNPLDLNALNATEQDQYDFLCGEISSLLDTNFCQFATAINENAYSTIGIYPNPVGRQLQIILKDLNFYPGEDYSGRIFDNRGSLVQVFALQLESNASVSTVTTSQLPAGTYQLVITENGNPIAVSSFIKQGSSAVK